MRVVAAVAVCQVILAIACRSESNRKPAPVQAERQAKVESSSTAFFREEAYTSFLRELESSSDPARRGAAVVLRSGHDETIPQTQYSAVSNVLAQIGIFMPLGSGDVAFDERYGSTRRRVLVLYELDKALNGSPIPGTQNFQLTQDEAIVVAEAVAAAQFADLRGGSLSGRTNPYDEMRRVLERHGFHEYHSRRGELAYAIAFLDGLLIHTVSPGMDSAERQMFRDLANALAQFERDRSLYVRARNKLGRSLIDQYVSVDKRRWPGLMPPPLWRFDRFEWERFDIRWDGTGELIGKDTAGSVH